MIFNSKYFFFTVMAVRIYQLLAILKEIAYFYCYKSK